MSFSVVVIRLKSFRRLSGSRTQHLKKANLGELSRNDLGSSIFEPSVYRGKSIGDKLRSETGVKYIAEQQNAVQQIAAFHVSPHHERELLLGTSNPTSQAERAASAYFDAHELHLESNDQRSEKRQDALMQSRALLSQEMDKRSLARDTYATSLTSRDYHQLLHKWQQSDKDSHEIEAFQSRLYDENGIFSEQRMDSFMLSDSSCFPEWVEALPYRIRDQVKFGNLGITEYEEGLRVRLGRLSREERIKEWNRIKRGRNYQISKAETLTITELRDARQGQRRFHWLLRKRQRRASAFRRLSLRNPEVADIWPSGMVDYSQRVAFIAQHLENGIETKGKWPLEEGSLVKATQKKKPVKNASQLDEERALSSNLSSGISELLKKFETKIKNFKRISHKAYANRVNAVTHGDQDEFGRNVRGMVSKALHRQRPIESFQAEGLERETAFDRIPNDSTRFNTGENHWPKHTRSWVEGMPSTRYGS